MVAAEEEKIVGKMIATEARNAYPFSVSFHPDEYDQRVSIPIITLAALLPLTRAASTVPGELPS
jgi:hypothetical protein